MLAGLWCLLLYFNPLPLLLTELQCFPCWFIGVHFCLSMGWWTSVPYQFLTWEICCSRSVTCLLPLSQVSFVEWKSISPGDFCCKSLRCTMDNRASLVRLCNLPWIYNHFSLFKIKKTTPPIIFCLLTVLFCRCWDYFKVLSPREHHFNVRWILRKTKPDTYYHHWQKWAAF